MRVVSLIALLVMLGGGIAWLVLDASGDSGPGDAPGITPNKRPDPADVRADPIAADRESVPGETPPADDAPTGDTPPRGDTPPGKTDATGEHPDPAAPLGKLVLAPVDRPSNRALTVFRYTLEQPGAERRAAQVEDTEVELEVRLDAPASVVVEADGYEPSPPIAVTLTAAEPRRRLPVPLEPVMRGSGIELHVFRRSDRRPITRLEVELRSREAALPEDPGDELWVRRVESAGDGAGQYELPPLKPGDYWLIAHAIDADGKPLPLLPVREPIRFSGNEGIRIHEDLAPGALLDLTVIDARGAPLGKEVAVALRDAFGEPVPCSWRIDVDGRRRVRRGGLPAAGTCSLHRAVPPGRYTLVVQRGTANPIERPIALPAGQTSAQRVVVPD